MNRLGRSLLPVLLVSVAVCTADAAVFNVTSTGNSGVGTLRWAIEQANLAAGPHRITFAIPGTGPHMIQPLTALPAVNSATAIDARTQPGYVSLPTIAGTPLIELDGTLAGAVDGIVLQAPGASVRGLSVGNFGGTGIFIQLASACTLAANHIGCNAAGTLARPNNLSGVYVQGGTAAVIGGVDARARNLISGNGESGIYADQTFDLKVQGNYIGTNAAGTEGLPNEGTQVNISEGARSQIGGLSPGQRNLISGDGIGGTTNGIAVLNATHILSPGDGNRIHGNRIGTNVYGLGSLPNDNGVFLGTQHADVVGNLISGNYGWGVLIYDTGNGNVRDNVIQDNLIGPTWDGTTRIGNESGGLQIDGSSGNHITHNIIGPSDFGPGVWVHGNGATGNHLKGNAIGTNFGGLTNLGNEEHGVLLDTGPNHLGGTLPGEGNIIANSQPGVVVNSLACVSLRRNRIYSNSNLNLDNGDEGVTPNDPNDADVGANTLQNFPILSSVTSSAGQLTVQGSLQTAPNLQVAIDIFSSPECHVSGYGGGEMWVGSVSGTTNGSGVLPFTFNGSVGSISGFYFTATATAEVDQCTSEFSPCFEMTQTVDAELPQSGNQRFSLGSPYPQPVRQQMRIPFALPRSSHVTVRVYDTVGRRVATLMDEERDAGSQQVEWRTSGIAPGVYRLRLEAVSLEGDGERFSASRSVIVVH